MVAGTTEVNKVQRISSFCLVVVVLSLVGCTRLSKEEMPSNSPLWNGYVQGYTYEVTQNVFLLKLQDEKKGVRYALSPDGSIEHPNRFYTAPKSLALYEQQGGKVSETDLVAGRAYQIASTTVGVIKANTRIKCTSLKKYQQWSWFFGSASWVTVYGVLQDGAYAGTEIDMTDLSIERSVLAGNEEIAAYKPNPRLLSHK